MSTTTRLPHTPEQSRKPLLIPAEIRALDPYELMAELGKTVIHPGGGRPTKALLQMAWIERQHRVLDAG
jgi:hypothetical protein